MMVSVFTDSALWARSVIESPCPCVCIFVIKVVIANNGQSIRFLSVNKLSCVYGFKSRRTSKLYDWFKINKNFNNVVCPHLITVNNGGVSRGRSVAVGVS